MKDSTTSEVCEFSARSEFPSEKFPRRNACHAERESESRRAYSRVHARVYARLRARYLHGRTSGMKEPRGNAMAMNIYARVAAITSKRAISAGCSMHAEKRIGIASLDTRTSNRNVISRDNTAPREIDRAFFALVIKLHERAESPSM